MIFTTEQAIAIDKRLRELEYKSGGNGLFTELVHPMQDEAKLLRLITYKQEIHERDLLSALSSISKQREECMKSIEFFDMIETVITKGEKK